ncbi:MAG TPA: PAS domain S-box protein [Chitinispirillaceae bacterium]|nr:PAS domain S-box protein [Chitinispirillaceae bacterium]
MKKKSPLIDELNALRSENAVLKNAEVRFRKLVEQSRDGIVILNDNGKVYDANQKFADMIGYTLEETCNLSVWDWDKTIEREKLKELAKEVDEKGHHFNTVHTRKDNTTYEVELSNSGTIVDGKKLIFCICRDISDRKRNEARLLESQELLSTFIDNFKGIAYQVAIEHSDTFAPRLFRGAIEEITGYAIEDFTTLEQWNTIIYHEDIAKVEHKRQMCLKLPESEAEMEYRITARNGKILWVKENTRIVKISNETLLHGTIFNITQQKKAEEEKFKLEEQIRHSQKLEAIGTLAGGVAHDFNNILCIIMGYADLILKMIPAEHKAYNHLTQIKKASIRARDIIQQLLTFSRKVEIKKEPIDVGPIITEALTFLRSTLPSSINIHQHIDINNTMILADPTQIHQVIMNLCVNAAQALQNREGTIEVTVTTSCASLNKIEACRDLPEGKYIKIDITDNGPGIPPEIAGRIFDPYFTTRGNSNGSGMGLAVVHGIVKNHDGCITMSSIPDRGTTFTLYLPVVNSRAESVESSTDTSFTGTESILLVDDEEDITAICKLLLEDHGFRVKTEVNPLNALNTFRSNPVVYDCIITDMTMPNMTGDTLFREIRKIRSDIPVILCTGHSDYINEEEAIAIGISAFVHKPLNINAFVDIIRTVIDNAHEVK